MAALGRHSACFLESVRAMKPERSTFRRFLNVAPTADGDVFNPKNFKHIIDMDHMNENNVMAYYEMQARIRENLGIPSFTQMIADLLDGAAEEAPDVRTILTHNKNLRHEAGIEDDMGADDTMFQALTRVVKGIGKPLTREDATGMASWKKEIDKINARLKIKNEDLEKLEEEAEYAAAKAELEVF